MCRAKLYANKWQKEESAIIAEKLRKAEIEFDCIPTSGPITLNMANNIIYGPSSILYLIDKYLVSANNKHLKTV